MRLTIDGRDLPGRRFVSAGVPLENVHVGVQVGKEPVGLVPGDAPSAHWDVDVRTVVDDAEVDLRGPAIHGKRGARFLYLTWGDVGADGSFAMFRRAKLMAADIEPSLLAAAASVADGALRAEIVLTDERGGPRCARVRPPAVTWSRPQASGRGSSELTVIELRDVDGGAGATCCAIVDGSPTWFGVGHAGHVEQRLRDDGVEFLQVRTLSPTREDEGDAKTDRS